MLWIGFSLRLSQYFGALSFSSTLMSPSVPATAWGCYQHTLLLGWYSAGDEQSWFPSNMMLRIEVHQTRESCFSQSEGPLVAFLLILSVFSCVYTEERIEFGHTAIKPRSVECCSDVCPSVSFSNLHIWSWSSTRVTIGFMVTTLTKALLHQLVSLVKRPALGRILVVSNSSIKVTETTCICDPSMKQNFFQNSSPDVWLDTNLFLRSTGSSFDLRACFLLWYALSAIRSFIKTCAFPNHTHSIEFATG